jgi:hypothetical protein
MQNRLSKGGAYETIDCYSIQSLYLQIGSEIHCSRFGQIIIIIAIYNTLASVKKIEKNIKFKK